MPKNINLGRELSVSSRNRSEVLCVHRANAVTGESPVWDATRGILWWIDIQGHRLLGYAQSSGRNLEFALPSMPGLVALSTGPALVLGLEDGLWTFVPETGAAQRIWTLEDDPRVRLNDGKPDAQGRLWFGSMDKTGGGAAIGALFCRQVDGQVRRVFTDIGVANGIAISPDGGTLYFADSRARQLRRYALDQRTGELSGEQLHIEYPEGSAPDGTAVDAEGGVWVAVVGAGRLDRVLPDGRVERSIGLPVTRPTMPAFGGSDLRALYVTSQRRTLSFEKLAQEPLAGNLIAIGVGVAGLPTRSCRIG